MCPSWSQTHFVAEDDLRLPSFGIQLLSLVPKVCSTVEPRASCMLGEHSTIWDACPGPRYKCTNTVVHLHCQVGRIWSHLGDTPSGVPVRVFPERFSWGGNIHPGCRWHCPMSWGHGLNTKEEASWELVFISLSLLRDDRCYGVSCVTVLPTCLLHHDWLHLFKPWAKVNPPFTNLLLPGILL